jgi:predicted DNA-binding transcriptional regulator YafY
VKRKKVGPSGWHTLTLKVIPNYELESLLLSFVPRIRVVSPEWLRMSVMQKLKDGLGLHDG